MRCPGQDTRFWKPGDIFEAPCPKCGGRSNFSKMSPSASADVATRSPIRIGLRMCPAVPVCRAVRWSGAWRDESRDARAESRSKGFIAVTVCSGIAPYEIDHRM